MAESSIVNPQSPILAVHSGALGDVILFGRLLELLADSADVTLLAGGEKSRLLAGLGAAGRAMDFDSLPMHEIFTDSPLESCRLPGLLGRHDRLISCFGAGESRTQMRFAAACGANQTAFLPIRPDDGFQGHLLELWCDMPGIESSKSKGERRVAKGETTYSSSPSRPSPFALRHSLFAAWPVPLAWRKRGKVILKELGLAAPKNVTVLHVGAGAREKCWPLENFIALGRRIASQEELRAQVVFVLGPAEMERIEGPVVDELRRHFPVLASPPLESLAGLLADCSMYVGNDSGVSHLAAAVGAPCVTLFGPTNPTHFAPLGPRVRIVAAWNMPAISVQRVWDEVNLPNGHKSHICDGT